METSRQITSRNISRNDRTNGYQSNPPEVITEIFGKKVFNETVMRDRLPKNIFRKMMETIENHKPLESDVAEIVASTMKNWAIDLGATHFTHWFHPLTGSTAEKHDAFLVPMNDGQAILQFTGKDLVKGEPDASSFPSGGIRGTFEARGYTAWDPTSPAFIRETQNGDATLCIPTAFCSYNGEALDKKTPLLRSQEALSKSGTRLLNIIRDEKVENVNVSVGLEQEYFLVDSEFFHQRPDLVACGRTLFGADSYKGQSLDDHYFGSIKQRVLNFMQDAEQALYKLGIPVKTRHNEVAPGQFELAPVYEASNVAIDHNMLIMAVMKEYANLHGLKMLLHEKPFSGLNGSGKHCNWSLVDSNGYNLFSPGETPQNNKEFLLFLAATIRSLDKHAGLIRSSVAFAGNDHRLGGHEAPPAIMSAYLGDDLNAIVESLAKGDRPEEIETEMIDAGTSAIVKLAKDTSDRNRTSPFAFTGNKFEFRALGSSQHVSGPVYTLNTAMAESLDYLADHLTEKLEKGANLDAAINAVLHETLKAHERVIFNGDNYSKEWEKEAEKRGLPNFKTLPDAVTAKIIPESVALFEKYSVLSKNESISRYNIKLETYTSKLDIEFNCTLDIAKTVLLPAAIKYQREVAESITKADAVLHMEMVGQKEMLRQLTGAIEGLINACQSLTERMEDIPVEDLLVQAKYYKNQLIPAMDEVRSFADLLETMVDDNNWPLPKYRELLFLL